MVFVDFLYVVDVVYDVVVVVYLVVGFDQVGGDVQQVVIGSDQVIGGVGGVRGVGGGDLGLVGLFGLGGVVVLGQCVLLEVVGGGGEYRGEQQCGSKFFVCYGGIFLFEWVLYFVFFWGVVLVDVMVGLD